MKLRSIIKTKKSGFEDVFFVMIILFAVIIALLVINKAWTEIKSPLDTGLTSAMPSDTSVNITTTLDSVSSTTVLFDKLIPFLVIGLFAFVMLGAAIYADNPIMIFVAIIILAVAILLGAIYSNVYHQFAESDSFASTTDNFPISDIYMKFLPYIIFIMAIGIGAMVMYLKSNKGGGRL